MYRQFAIGALQAGMQQNMKKLPDESDEQFAERQQIGRRPDQSDNAVYQRSRHGEGGLGDRRSGEADVLRFRLYQFVQGSKLAKQLAAYSQPNTNFAGFYQPDAAATAMVATQGRSEAECRRSGSNRKHDPQSAHKDGARDRQEAQGRECRRSRSAQGGSERCVRCDRCHDQRRADRRRRIASMRAPIR